MSQLRSFTGFNKTAAFVPILAGYDSRPTSFPCKLVDLTVNYAGSGGEFLQIFDKASVAVADDVPVYCIALTSAGFYSLFQTVAPISLNTGFSVGISTSRFKYAAASSTYDISGDIEEFEDPFTGVTIVGDLTTPTDNRTVWTDANGPKRLLRVDFMMDGLSGGGATRYLMLFAEDSPTDGQRPIMQWGPYTDDNTTVNRIDFGTDGFSPFSLAQIAFGSAFTPHDGCYLVLSDTTKVLTYSGGGSTDNCKIKAYYKT